MKRISVTTITFLYGGYVLIATLYPFDFSSDLLTSFSQFWRGFFKWSFSRDFIENICLFVPFGALVYCWLVTDKKKLLSILLATLVGAVVSVLIELLQVFFARDSSVFDVVANTLGTAAGAIFSSLWPRRLADLAGHAWKKLEGSWALLGIAVLYGAVPLVLSVVQFVGPFRTWNSFFSFQIGNEATFNRPWLGKIHFVALYKRALPADEIARRFQEGFGSLPSKHPNAAGLISLYTFNEGEGNRVHDVSGYEAPLDLHISPADRVRWLDPSGIEILRPTILKSQGAATKLVDAVSETDELSIEMWITPENTVQRGPARIVSFSRHSGTRNFTVGQEGSDIHFRLRTPVTGRNGHPPALKTTSRFLSTDTFHIVATYKAGMQKLYSNGLAQPETLDLTRDGIIGFGARKTALAQLAYSFYYFAPVSILIAAFFSRRFTHFIFPAVSAIGITAALVGSTELFQAWAFHRAIDVTLVLCGIIIAVMGSLVGLRLGSAAQVETGLSSRPGLNFSHKESAQ